MTGFLASRFMSDLFTGLANGVLFALVALSLVIIWQSTHILNFAQGAMAMLATYVGLSQIEHKINFWLCALIAIAVGLVIGGITERVLIRPLYGKPEINPIVVMVGFLGVIEAVASAVWGTMGRTINPPFSSVDFQSHGRTIQISPFIVFQVVAAAAIMILVALLFRYTKLGLQLRAAASAPEVARLLGVKVNRMLTLGWMMSCAVGAVAAIILSTSQPIGLFPTNMDVIFISGFIAAAIGGLESPFGAVAGGLLLGVAEVFIGDYWSNNIEPAAGLIVLIVVLMVRPQGLFSAKRSRRV
jgi:branched-chain amino acid transport system permease protein